MTLNGVKTTDLCYLVLLRYSKSCKRWVLSRFVKKMHASMYGDIWLYVNAFCTHVPGHTPRVHVRQCKSPYINAGHCLSAMQHAAKIELSTICAACCVRQHMTMQCVCKRCRRNQRALLQHRQYVNVWCSAFKAGNCALVSSVYWV